MDGILTTGTIYIGNQEQNYLLFHIHDRLGITVATSGRKADYIESQLRHTLNIQHFYSRQENKQPAYEVLKQTWQSTDEQIAYMGDD
jgi:3-deoxy-D-manno-octulosonate 8-phosphate phosphatase KdsC-like HAD superfamily phosphatase